MSVFKFRVVLEQDDTIFRDIEIKPTQTFADFHYAIIKAFAFDGKHEASFFTTNDNWVIGSEIALNKKPNAQSMSKILMASLIDDPHQKFIYTYDYDVEWNFLIELMSLEEEKKKITYPQIVKSEGVAPKQYGAQPIADKEVDGYDIEEKYDEHDSDEMGEEGDETESNSDDESNEESDEFGGEFGSEHEEI